MYYFHNERFSAEVFGYLFLAIYLNYSWDWTELRAALKIDLHRRPVVWGPRGLRPLSSGQDNQVDMHRGYLQPQQIQYKDEAAIP